MHGMARHAVRIGMAFLARLLALALDDGCMHLLEVVGVWHFNTVARVTEQGAVTRSAPLGNRLSELPMIAHEISGVRNADAVALEAF